VLSELGLSATTVREIASRAGVHPALLHYYFKTKAGLFSVIMEETTRRLHGTLQTPPAPDSASGKLGHLVRACALVFSEDRYVPRLLLHELVRPEHTQIFTLGIGELLSRQLRGIVDLGISSGEFKYRELPLPLSDIAPQLLCFFLMMPLGSSVPSGTQIESWSQEVTQLVLHGLRGAV